MLRTGWLYAKMFRTRAASRPVINAVLGELKYLRECNSMIAGTQALLQQQ